MADQLRIELLGGCTIRYNGETTRFKSRKAEAILAYLAHRARPFSRSDLAEIFWPDSTPQQATANLRKTLSDLRRHAAPFLLIDRQQVAIAPQSRVWLDTAVFTNEIAAAKSATDPIPALQKAVNLYRGEFLAGFYLRDSLAFDEWASLERERLHLAVTDGLRQLVAHFLHCGRYAEGIRHAARWLALDPLNEAGARFMMRLQARHGQRNEALAQYEACRQRLRAELAVTPTPYTQKTAARIRAAGERPALRTTTAALLGRNREICRLSRRLEQPDCRLITLTGPGGVGKTRLALHTAETQQAEFLDGVSVIYLADVTLARLETTLTDHFALTDAAAASPRRQLLDYLRHKEMLLVLDNFEHLQPASDLLAEILETAVSVTLLVTSRARLHLDAEWVLELNGLPLPPDDGGEQPLTDYAALQLFQERAAQARPDFALTPANQMSVLQICRLVAGLPLGIELAAATVRAFTPAQIAAQIGQTLDFLQARARGLPPRHRSMRAVLDYSWQMLSPAEQEALSRLAVFSGQFTPAAATAVTHASNRTLTALVHKSLLLRTADGRFYLHDLLHQFAGEHLALDAPAQQAAAEEHGRFYADRLQKQFPLLRSSRQKEAIQSIQQEADNVLAAWSRAVRQQQFDRLHTMLEPLYWYFRISGRYQAGLAAVQQATQQWPAPPAAHPPAAARFWARLYVHQAMLAYVLADYPLAETSLNLAESGNLGPEDRALILRQRGRLAQARGQYELAQEWFQQSLTAWRVLQDDFRIATVLLDLGNTCIRLNRIEQAESYLQASLAQQTEGDLAHRAKVINSLATIAQLRTDFSAAAAQYEESLALRRQLGDKEGMANLLNNLGNVACNLENWDAARAYYRQSLALKRELGAPLGIAVTLSNLGTVYQELQEYDTAAALYEESLALSEEIDDLLGVVYCTANLAGLAHQRAAYADSYRWWQQTLHLSREMGVKARVLYNLVEIAALCADAANPEADPQLAAEILQQVLSDPECAPLTRERAGALLAQSDFPHPASPSPRPLSQIIAEILA